MAVSLFLRRPFAGLSACMSHLKLLCDGLLFVPNDKLKGVWYCLAGWRSAQRSFIPHNPWERCCSRCARRRRAASAARRSAAAASEAGESWPGRQIHNSSPCHSVALMLHKGSLD